MGLRMQVKSMVENEEIHVKCEIIGIKKVILGTSV